MDKTDHITMEYVKLAPFDLRFNFLYRFKAPVETNWKNAMIMSTSMDVESSLKRFGLDTWNKVPDEKVILKDEAWVFEMKTIKLIKCEIKPKFEGIEESAWSETL